MINAGRDTPRPDHALEYARSAEQSYVRAVKAYVASLQRKDQDVIAAAREDLRIAAMIMQAARQRLNWHRSIQPNLGALWASDALSDQFPGHDEALQEEA